MRSFSGASRRLAAFGTLAADQFLDPFMNLIADRSDCFERLPLGIGERSVVFMGEQNVRAIIYSKEHGAW
jgi:hypothetical protein